MPSSVHYRPSACRLLLLTLGLLTLPGSAFAGGQPPAERNGGRPYHAVKVAENAVTLPSLPDFRLHVPDEFSFLGATRFNLDGKAEADVFVFAIVVGDSIERFIKVQVESLVDEEARDYHWTGEDTLRVAEAEYIRGFWCFDAAEAARERPNGDTAKTQKWLASIGHHQAGVFVGTRLARVFAGGRSELLLFYGESTSVSGVDCGDEKAAMEHLPAIIARSDAALALGP